MKRGEKIFVLGLILLVLFGTLLVLNTKITGNPIFKTELLKPTSKEVVYSTCGYVEPCLNIYEDNTYDCEKEPLRLTPQHHKNELFQCYKFH